MPELQRSINLPKAIVLLLVVQFLLTGVSASLGDRLPEFKECVSVWHSPSPDASHSALANVAAFRYAKKRIASVATLCSVSLADTSCLLCLILAV